MNFLFPPHSIPTHFIFLWQKYSEHIKPLVDFIVLKQCVMLKHTLAKEEKKIVQCVISPALRNEILLCYLIVHIWMYLSQYGIILFIYFQLTQIQNFPGPYLLFQNLYCFSITKVPGTLGDWKIFRWIRVRKKWWTTKQRESKPPQTPMSSLHSLSSFSIFCTKALGGLKVEKTMTLILKNKKCI